jgi:hypothetical protein
MSCWWSQQSQILIYKKMLRKTKHRHWRWSS